MTGGIAVLSQMQLGPEGVNPAEHVVQVTASKQTLQNAGQPERVVVPVKKKPEAGAVHMTAVGAAGS